MHSATWMYYLGKLGKSWREVTEAEREHYHANYHAIYVEKNRDAINERRKAARKMRKGVSPVLRVEGVSDGPTGIHVHVNGNAYKV